MAEYSDYTISEFIEIFNKKAKRTSSDTGHLLVTVDTINTLVQRTYQQEFQINELNESFFNSKKQSNIEIIEKRLYGNGLGNHNPQKAIEIICKKLIDNKKGIGKQIGSAAVAKIHMKHDNTSQAIFYFKEANQYEKAGNTLLNIAKDFEKTNNYGQAESYLYKAADMFKDNNLPLKQIKAYKRIDALYRKQYGVENTTAIDLALDAAETIIDENLKEKVIISLMK